MAAKEYKINLPGGTVVKMMANSAHQAAKRAERQYGMDRVVNQRSYVSNRTKNMVNVKGYEHLSEDQEIDA